MSTYSHLRLVAPTLIAALATAAWLSPANALPAYKNNVVALYKLSSTRLDTCNVCHTSGGGSPRNAYGKAFMAAGADDAAVRRIGAQDSDGDGVSNDLEFKTLHFPGDPGDKPTAEEIARVTGAPAPPKVDPLLGLWKVLGGADVKPTAVPVKLTPEQTVGIKATVPGTKDADIAAITMVGIKDAAGAAQLLIAVKVGTPEAPQYLALVRDSAGKVTAVKLLAKDFRVVKDEADPYLAHFLQMEASSDWSLAACVSDEGATAPSEYEPWLSGADRALEIALLLAAPTLASADGASTSDGSNVAALVVVDDHHQGRRDDDDDHDDDHANDDDGDDDGGHGRGRGRGRGRGGDDD